MHGPITRPAFHPQRKASSALSARDLGCSTAVGGSHSPPEDTAPHRRTQGSSRGREIPPAGLPAGTGVHPPSFRLGGWFPNPSDKSQPCSGWETQTAPGLCTLLPKHVPARGPGTLQTPQAMRTSIFLLTSPQISKKFFCHLSKICCPPQMWREATGTGPPAQLQPCPAAGSPLLQQEAGSP